MVNIFNVSYTVFKNASLLTPIYYFATPKADGYILGTGTNEIVYKTNIRNGSDVDDFIDNLLPTAHQVEKEDDVLALPTFTVFEQLQTQYDIGDDVIYIGYARCGIATDVIGWTIKRFILENGVVTNKKITAAFLAIWENRTSEEYY